MNATLTNGEDINRKINQEINDTEVEGDNKLTTGEVREIEEGLGCIAPEELIKVQTHIDTLKTTANQSTKAKLDILKGIIIAKSEGQVCVNTGIGPENFGEKQKGGFEELINGISNSQELTRTMNMIEPYFDSRLEAIGITGSEKNSIKLVLWDRFQDNIGEGGAIGSFISGLVNKISSIGGKIGKILSNKGGKENIDLGKSFKELEKIFTSNEEGDKKATRDMFDHFDKFMIGDFDKIKEAKDKIKDEQDKGIEPFMDLNNPLDVARLLAVTDDRKKELSQMTLEQYYESVEKITAETGDFLKNSGGTIKEGLGLIEQFAPAMELFKGLMEKPLIGVILKWILSALFGEDFLNDFLDGKTKERKESVDDLIEYSKKDGSLLKGLDGENISADDEDMVNFFKYFEGKEVKYSENNNFWKKIAGGNPENEEINKVHLAMKYKLHGDENSTEPIFTLDDYKNNNAGFKEKVGSVEEAVKEYDEYNTMEKENTVIAGVDDFLASPTATPVAPAEGETLIPATSEATTEGETPTPVIPVAPAEGETPTPATPEAPTEVEIEKGKSFRDVIISEHIRNAKELPIEIDYNTIGGEKKVGLSEKLNSLGIELPNKIDFNDGKLILGDKNYKIEVGNFVGDSIQGRVEVSNFQVRSVKIEQNKIIFSEGTLDYKGTWKDGTLDFAEQKGDDRMGMSKNDLNKMIQTILSLGDRGSFSHSNIIGQANYSITIA